MSCKFKFDPNSPSVTSFYDRTKRIHLIGDNYNIVSKPEEIPANAIRKGQYTIRNNGYYMVYEYYPRYNWWIELSKIEKGFWNKTTWNLFPSLPEKEYIKIGGNYKYLSKEWKDNFQAWKHWLELKEIRTSVRKSFLRVKKRKI